VSLFPHRAIVTSDRDCHAAPLERPSPSTSPRARLHQCQCDPAYLRRCNVLARMCGMAQSQPSSCAWPAGFGADTIPVRHWHSSCAHSSVATLIAQEARSCRRYTASWTPSVCLIRGFEIHALHLFGSMKTSESAITKRADTAGTHSRTSSFGRITSQLHSVRKSPSPIPAHAFASQVL
jgi:hypothetical protein